MFVWNIEIHNIYLLRTMTTIFTSSSKLNSYKHPQFWKSAFFVQIFAIVSLFSAAKVTFPPCSRYLPIVSYPLAYLFFLLHKCLQIDLSAISSSLPLSLPMSSHLGFVPSVFRAKMLLCPQSVFPIGSNTFCEGGCCRCCSCTFQPLAFSRWTLAKFIWCKIKEKIF